MRWADPRAPAWLQNDTSLVENMKGIHVVTKSTNVYYIVIALDKMHSSAVLSLFGFFFCQVAVGVVEIDARDESAPAQTSPQQAGFRLRSTVCVLAIGTHSWSYSYDKLVPNFTQHRYS